MRCCQPTRRHALQTIARSAVALLTVSVSARSLGLSTSAQIPEKIVLGTIPIIPSIGSYIGEVDFFKEEGLTVELTRFNNFAPIMQALRVARSRISCWAHLERKVASAKKISSWS
jgi:ABC-type nitrate/sulfonate/bicarbonate transport system substrate-binding protein